MSTFSNLELTDLAIVFVLIFVSLMIGIWGYSKFGRLGGADSFMEASMILSGMGPVNNYEYTSVKIFGGIFALYCGFIVIIIISYIVTRILGEEFKKT